MVATDRAAELLARWQETDDRGALEELLRGELSTLKARLSRPGTPGSPHDATQDDIAQGAVLRFLGLRQRPRFDRPAALRAYLWRTARNLLVDRLRGKGRRLLLTDRGTEDVPPDPATTTGGLVNVEQEDLRYSLELTLNLLRPEDREILREVYLRQRSIGDAAQALGLPRGVANTRLVRARLRLASKLADWEELLG